MKSALFSVFLCLQALCYGQISFEEIASPDDFSISAVRKSPTGEYFTQAYNDNRHIYSSDNGVDWTKEPLPEALTMDDIQFFSDGTPILKTELYGSGHLIRRNGNWRSMYVFGGAGSVEASFIKEDSLFVYNDEIFAYSLDKGQTFTTIFTFNGIIIDHTADLWKFDNHFVLHHAAGASDSLSVFNEQGERVFAARLSLGIPDILYNDCGEVLFFDRDNYYRIQNEGLSFEQGNTSDIIPNYSYGSEVLSQGGHYYIKKDDTIYKSPGCGFSWEPWATDELIQSKTDFWITAEEDLLLYNSRSDRFVERPGGTNQWEEHSVDINYAYVVQLDESVQGYQFSTTSNAFFNKSVNDANWIELGYDSAINDYPIQYSPDGDLYVNRGEDILFSQDNGITFSTIELPGDGLPFSSYHLEVLDDDLLFIIGYLGLGPVFYTLNNGQNWIAVDNSNLPFYLELPHIKLVNNSILIADLMSDYTVVKIDIATNEVIMISVGDFLNWDFGTSAVQQDGTMYFFASDASAPASQGFYQYRFGEEAEYIGDFPEVASLTLASTSANDLFAFGSNSYFKFDGTTFTEHSYAGLPATGYPQFFLSENEYLYALVGYNRIFRSTEPLAVPHYITGSVYHDANSDCAPDPSDDKLKFWVVKVENDNHLQIKTTNSEGDFRFSVPFGDYTLSCQPITANWELCESSFDVTVDAENIDLDQDFHARGLVDCAGLEIDFSTPRLRRCFDNYYSVRVRNTGPQPSDATTLTLELDPFFDLTSVSVPYAQVGEDSIQVDLGAIAVNDQIVFRIFFNLSCEAPLSMEHCLTGSLSDRNLCSHGRPVFTECQENIGSFDPNDKRIFNEDGIEVDAVDKEEYIYYHIRFQNTGTDTAFTVRIIDPLSPALNVNTLEMLSASHPYTYSISDGPELIVNFENILLPDSTTNEPASHGFFKFKIKPLPEFDYGTSISNQAGIFFDFNEPVITNEATLSIQQTVATKEAGLPVEFDVFPNPAKDKLSLAISANDLNRIDAYKVINQLGQPVPGQTNILDHAVLNIAGLAPGVYFIMLVENGVVVGMRKFVKI